MNLEQQQAFERDGLTCIRGAVGRAEVDAIRDRLWEVAETKRGISREDRASWQRVPPALMKQARVNEGLFEPMFSDVVCNGIDALLGDKNWQRPPIAGQLLMSPPDAEKWDVPHKVWHLDFPAPGWVGNVLPGVQLFLLLDRLDPQQGGTLVVAGSHRLTSSLDERSDEDFAGTLRGYPQGSAATRALAARVVEAWPGRIADRTIHVARNRA
ncbi:MAG: phytanoyl-CoA dioxygenase family protein [Myxococcales bacterium]